MTFYISYVINDVESNYTTSITGKTDAEKKPSTLVLHNWLLYHIDVGEN